MAKRPSRKRRKRIAKTNCSVEVARRLLFEMFGSEREMPDGMRLDVDPRRQLIQIKIENVYIQDQRKKVSSQTDQSSSCVSIGRDVRGAENVLQAGHHNDASTEYLKIGLPSSGTVDIREELCAIRDILTRLDSDHADDIAAALNKADEAVEADDDKDAIGEALERAIQRASKASDFVEAVGQLAKHVFKAAAWLGTKWHGLVELILAGGP